MSTCKNNAAFPKIPVASAVCRSRPASQPPAESLVEGIIITGDTVNWVNLIQVPAGFFGFAIIRCQGSLPNGNSGGWVSKVAHFGFSSWDFSPTSGRVNVVSGIDDAQGVCPDFDIRLTGSGSSAYLQVRLRDAIGGVFASRLFFIQ